jgi:hypothetical protein
LWTRRFKGKMLVCLVLCRRILGIDALDVWVSGRLLSGLCFSLREARMGVEERDRGLFCAPGRSSQELAGSKNVVAARLRLGSEKPSEPGYVPFGRRATFPRSDSRRLWESQWTF